MDAIDNVINAISSFLYNGPGGKIPFVIIFLLVGGIYLTIRSRGVQFNMLGEGFKVIMEKPEGENATSSFGALMVSTASRVGTGNIIGVSTAICLGGYGAVFWMWVIALVGGASAFVESTLAQIYKKRDDDGSSYGGPSYYMEQALGQRWMGVLFAIFVILTYAVGYNAVAAYNVQSTFAVYSFYNDSTPIIIGIVLAVLFAICILGGGTRMVKVSEYLVPIMGVIYVAVALFVIIINIGRVPAMFGEIFRSAFDFKAIFGGFSGSCMMYGIKRGLYSNEAGMGSAPNAAATASVSHPVKQGLVQTLSVYLDTLVICTATAFMCMLSGFKASEDVAGAAYVQGSLEKMFGSFGPTFIVVSLALFAFTTIIGNYFYCEGCLRFIFKRKPSKTFLTCFRLFAAVIVFVGAIASMALVWDMADLTQALMVVVNVPAIFILAKVACDCLKDYKKQKAEGKDPVFKAADIGLKEKTDFWN